MRDVPRLRRRPLARTSRARCACSTTGQPPVDDGPARPVAVHRDPHDGAGPGRPDAAPRAAGRPPRRPTTLQVGLEPDRRLLLATPPRPGRTSPALRRLRRRRRPGRARARRRPRRGGRGAARPRTRPTRVAQGAVTAAFAQHGPAAAGPAGRAPTGDGVARAAGRGDGAWAATAGRPPRPGGDRAASPTPTRPRPWRVVLSDGEPDRDALDDALRTGRPHLVLTASGGAVRVGPVRGARV